MFKSTFFLGILLALASGAALGFITSFAAFSYQHGAGALDLILLRGMIAALFIWVFCRFTGEPAAAGAKINRYTVLIGLSLCLVGFGYMASVLYISPGLAVALLYLYPIMVLIADSFYYRKRPGGITILAFAVALMGIATCVGIGDASMDPKGIILAVLAACGMAGVLFFSSLARKAGIGMPVLIGAQGITIIAAIGLILILRAASGDLVQLPGSGIGLAAMLAASGFYALGILLSFMALRHAPSPQVALMMNVEPITTLLAAWLLVGEQLSGLQYGGILIAVAGIGIGGYVQMQKNSH